MIDILVKRIKQVMESKSISQAELARLTGIRASSISDYLAGKYKPKQDKIALIADALSVSPGWLMGYDFKTPDKKDILKEKKFNFYATPEEQELVKKYRILPPDGKNTVDAVLNVQYDIVKPKVIDKKII